MPLNVNSSVFEAIREGKVFRSPSQNSKQKHIVNCYSCFKKIVGCKRETAQIKPTTSIQLNLNAQKAHQQQHVAFVFIPEPIQFIIEMTGAYRDIFTLIKKTKVYSSLCNKGWFPYNRKESREKVEHV